MRFEIAAYVRQSRFDLVSIEGEIFLSKEPALLLGEGLSAGRVRVGFQAFAGAVKLVDDRATSDAEAVIEHLPLGFKIDVKTDVIGPCDVIRIGIVEEGVRWIYADDEGSLFSAHHDIRTDERWLLPGSMKGKYFARHRSGSRWLLATNYLAALRARYGNATAVDFCSEYFLGRPADRSTMSRSGHILADGSPIVEVVRHFLALPEYRERASRGNSLADPYLSLGVWL